MYTSKFQLYLFPEKADNTISPLHLLEILKKIQFVGEAQSSINTNQRFLSGDKFLSHLCFLGCSPDIEFSPHADKPYIYIEIPTPTDTPLFISGINLKVAKCPYCKKVLSSLPNILKQSTNPTRANCHHCSKTLEVSSLNWRKTAALCRCSIIIHTIYESEAVPDDQLLSALEVTTGFKWKYAYIRIE